MRQAVTKLEDLPNIGKSIASDLRNIGIVQAEQLAQLDPLEVFHKLTHVMGHRQDPCVFYTLLSVRHFLDTGEAVVWWKFTAEGKRLLKSDK